MEIGDIEVRDVVHVTTFYSSAVKPDYNLQLLQLLETWL